MVWVRHDLNSKQTKTKCAIFAQPTAKNITWDEIVSLLSALGCVTRQKPGSAVTFEKGKIRLNIHRPHPENTLQVYQIQAVRNFLFQIGEIP